MKKLFFILLLSLFTLGLNASESDGILLCEEGYELQIGDWVKRSEPCVCCDADSGWIVVDKNEFGASKFRCVVCNYEEWK